MLFSETRYGVLSTPGVSSSHSWEADIQTQTEIAL